MMAHGDMVIDLDAIQRKINPTFRSWAENTNSKLLRRAIKVRNMMLGHLSDRISGCAWFIVSAPSPKEREWWQRKLGGEVVLLNPGLEECKRRAYARGTPLAARGVALWAIRSEMQWEVPTQRRPIRFDGWFADHDMDEADVVLAQALAP
jgi:5-methylcytosine-specific restriction protein A